MRRRNSTILLLLLAVNMLAVGLLLALRQASSPSVNSTMVTPGETGTTLAYIATVAFEDTAVAIFTRNPTLALSSTPYFAEIIYNNVLRNLTQVAQSLIPFAPTAIETLPSQSLEIEGIIASIADIEMSSAEREQIALQMTAIGLDGGIWAGASGVTRINDTNYNRFVPIRSIAYIDINITSIQDRTTITSIFEKLVVFLAENQHFIAYTSPTGEVNVEIKSSDGSLNIKLIYSQITDAYERGLTGAALLEALGGA